ncbi:ABC transporter permease [Streptomonospora sediminis]
MWKATLAGLRAHRLRVFLAGLATVIGVAFISGSMVLGDTLQADMQRTVTANAAEVDVAVLGSSALRKLPESAAGKISRIEGVDRVEGVLEGPATLLGRDGRPADRQPVAASAGIRTEIARGSAPAGDGQVALAQDTARSNGYRIGDKVGVLDHRGHRHELRLTGLVDTRGRGDFALRGAMLFTAARTAEITGEERFRSIYVTAADVPAPQLRRQVARVVDTDAFEVLTGRQWADRQASSSGLDPALVSTALLMFALVTLLVAGFVIYNTFSILVAQRMRELALLRCVGASRRQVFTGVLAESAVIGALAAALGLALGIAAGYGAVPVLNAFGNDLPYEVVTVSWTTLAVGPAAGVLVTAAAAALPARAATRVAPVAALSAAPVQGAARAGRRRRAAVAAVLCGLAAAAALWAVSVEPGQRYPLAVVAVSGMVFFAGAVAIGPVAIGPLARTVGFLPARLFGAPGRLAVANAARNPKRAATTTLALTIGVTLMTGVAVVTESFAASVSAGAERAIPVDYLITAPGAGSGPAIPPAVVAQLRASSGVTGVAAQREEAVHIGGRRAAVGTIGIGGPVEEPELVEGTPIDRLGPDQLALSPKRAQEFGLEVGDTVTVRRDGRPSTTLEVAAIVRARIFPPFFVTAAGFARHFEASGYQAVLANVAPGLSTEEADRIIDDATAAMPTAEVVGAQDARKQLESTLSNLVMIVAGLLGFAVVVSVIGIANTMTLSVVERTRESAVLRALGLSRRNLGLMLTIEALVLAVIGALAGVALGAAFGLAAAATIRADIVLAVPCGQIALIVSGAAAAGIAAAVLPARRAARTSIVSGLAGE